MNSATLFRPGETCWRVERADRIALLVDGANYFAAAKAAMLAARHSIWLLAWTFDPLTQLTPDAEDNPRGAAGAPRLGLMLRRLAALNPALDVRVLAWDQPPVIGATQAFPCQRGRAYFLGSRVKYRLDGTLPNSACHHQKVLVIDGRVAFVSGGDLGADRWDTCEHEDNEPHRFLPNGRRYPARHEVSLMLDGPAAGALGELFAERWARATGEAPPKPPPAARDGHSPWPARVAADLRGQPFAVARTDPKWRGREGVEECLRLHLASIAAARRLIYLENQYLASRLIVEALARRLAEPDGPEVIAIGPTASPSFFDRMTMDSARSAAINRLIAADRHGRFHAYAARTPKDGPVIVHSKVTIVDDWFLRIGSANLNNRSMGLDSECDIAVEASDDDARAAIRAFLAREIAHFMGQDGEAVEAAIAIWGQVGKAIDALDRTPRRLRPVGVRRPGPVERFVAAWSLGDPLRTDDAWRPWVRRRHIRRDLQRLLQSTGSSPASGGSGPIAKRRVDGGA